MISGEFEVCKIQFSTLVDKKVAKVVKLLVFKEQLSLNLIHNTSMMALMGLFFKKN